MSGPHRHVPAGVFRTENEHLLHDLGWNDMGGGEDVSSVDSAEPANECVTPEKRDGGQVVVMPGCESVAALDVPRRVTEKEQLGLTAKDRAAFTLRLDTERHLRLRLASAVTKRSAQNLVIEALDRYLAQLGDLDELAHLGKRH